MQGKQAFYLVKDLANAFWLGTKQLSKDVVGRTRLLNQLEEEFQVPRITGTFERLIRPEPLYPSASNLDAAIIRKAIDERKINFQQFCMLRDTGPDLIKVFPWVVGFMIPLVGYASPLVAAAFPHLLPSGFWTEATRFKMASTTLAAQHQRIQRFWLPFADSKRAPAVLSSLTEKALDGRLQSSDIDLLNHKLPPTLVDLQDDHLLRLNKIIGVEDVDSLTQSITRIQYEDELLRSTDLSSLTARELSWLFGSRCVPLLVTQAQQEDEEQTLVSNFSVEQLAAAREHIKRWSDLPIRTQTAVPHAAILQHINLSLQSRS